MPKQHGKDLRKGRFSLEGHFYHLTTVTRGRIRVFAEPAAARVVVRCLKDIEDSRLAASFAFVVMPDHLHWLMQLRGDNSLSSVMNRLKGRSSRALTASGIAVAPIWQRGYYDHAVRSYEDLKTIARYIVANPLRSKLVAKIGDYPWWDAVWL
ncbi:MAG TPA: transposase [Gammaproteobacteria bacterium]